jgi:hypothetical protein
MVNGKITVVGVVSFGRTTCTPFVANGYERVTYQKDWILSNSDAAAWQCGGVIGKVRTSFSTTDTFLILLKINSKP